MTRSDFEAKRDDLKEIVLRLPNDAAGNTAAVMILGQVLLAEAVNDLAIALEDAFAEVDPEDFIRFHARAAGDSDVRPLDEAAEESLRAAAQGADAFDPAAPIEDLEATLDERHSINQKR